MASHVVLFLSLFFLVIFGSAPSFRPMTDGSGSTRWALDDIPPGDHGPPDQPWGLASPGRGAGRGAGVPVCTVKRYRRSKSPSSSVTPGPLFVQPSPKTSSLNPPLMPCRWNTDQLSPLYRPPAFQKLVVGGLMPPPIPKHSGGPELSLRPGLAPPPPQPLQVHNRSFSFQTQLSQPGIATSPPPRRPISVPLAVSAPLDVPTEGICESHSDPSTMLALHKQLKSQHVSAWLSIVEAAGRHSELFNVTAFSENQDLHRAKVVAKYAPSTLSAYFGNWQRWLEFCECQGCCPFQPETSQVADFLQVSSRRSSLGVATAQSRALTWTAKHLGLSGLRQCLEAPLVKAYMVPSEITLRKEAAPLPLSFVIFLETRILKELGTAADRLLMGCVLTLVWASLRWSDALWVTPSSLHADRDTIRGVAARTKTTSRGMPFGFITAGFMSGSSSCNWATKWLNLVRAALQRTAEMYPHFEPDFLIPQCGPNLDHPMFVAPMPRAQGILLLRKFLLMSLQGFFHTEHRCPQRQGDLPQLGSPIGYQRRSPYGPRPSPPRWGPSERGTLWA